MAEEKKEPEMKLTWKGWLSLAFIILSFSGAMASMGGVWRAIDFQALTGNFGTISGKVNFQGVGGAGAREGVLFTITLIPTTMLALGMIQVAESLGALLAAEKLFRPILRPLMGIPGVTGLAFVSSFTSSDVGSVMTKGLYEEGHITDDERTVFVSYQYAGSASVTNTLGAGASLLPISVLPVGIVIAIIVFVKILGANFMRIFLKTQAKKEVQGGAA